MRGPPSRRSTGRHAKECSDANRRQKATDEWLVHCPHALLQASKCSVRSRRERFCRGLNASDRWDVKYQPSRSQPRIDSFSVPSNCPFVRSARRVWLAHPSCAIRAYNCGNSIRGAGVNWLGFADMNCNLTILVFALLLAIPTLGQATRSAKPIDPISTTVCDILEDPSAFNNKLVEVRGYVTVSFEYSILRSEACAGEIWFALADASGPPGLAVTVPGRGAPGEKDSNGHGRQPIPVSLIRDANYEKFERYLSESSKVQSGRPCGPDCHLYKVTATFIGRIDGVSKKVHAAHLRRSPLQSSDGKGFGQMGLFDAQLVVASVKGVDAVELTHIGKE